MKNIAFTFDDGPNLTTTIRMLDVLKENDAYHALEKCGGLIVTGPTGTNVNDLTAALIRR